ncbi:hypothetical protein FB451DRAFT_1209244 [Mycena latifolia]|nr:hypothetical protein FB451DRAFT_1209244 [Mycena latifolia]
MLRRRVGQRAAWPRRRGCRSTSTSTEGSSAPASTAASPSASTSTRVPEHPHLLHVLGQRSVVVRIVDDLGITSPRDALAIVRTVERRFGRVAEYRINRDAETPSRYQFLANIAFWDPAAYARVPQTPTVLRAVLPPKDDDPLSGGVGLADITSLLDAQEWTDNNLADEVNAHFDAPETPEDGSRIVELRVEHYTGRFQRNEVRARSILTGTPSRFSQAFAANFVRWGGFAPLKPLPGPLKITRSELLFGGAAVDRPHMRQVLQVFSLAYGVKNPYEVPTVGTLAPSSQRLTAAATATTSHPAPSSSSDAAAEVREALLDTLAESAPTLPQTDAPSSSPTPTEPTPQPGVAEVTVEAKPMQTPPPVEAKQPEAEVKHASPEAEVEQASPRAKAKQAAPKAAAKQAPPKAEPVGNQASPEAEAKPASPSAKVKPAATPKAAPKQPPPKAGPAFVTDRTQIRAARGVMRKNEPAKAEAPKKPVVNAKEPVKAAGANANEPAKKKKKEKESKPQPGPAQASVPERPIEVEERQTGMATRLKGMWGRWL